MECKCLNEFLLCKNSKRKNDDKVKIKNLIIFGRDYIGNFIVDIWARLRGKKTELLICQEEIIKSSKTMK